MSMLMENVSGVVGTNYEDMQRARTEQDRNVQTAQFVTTFITRSEAYTWSSRRRLPELYNLYRGVSRGEDHPFRNNVTTNSLFAAVEADVARKTRALLTGAPITFEGTPIVGGASYARKQQALYYQQDREDSGYLKKYLLIKAAGMYGTGVMQRGWRYEQRDAAHFETMQSPMDGKRYRIGRTARDTVFDGPSAKNIDLLDFFLEPGKNMISEARRAASRWWEDLDAVEARFESGEFTNRSELARLKQTGAVSADMYTDMRNTRGVDVISGNPKQYDPYSRPVQLVDFIGYVPRALSPDGITFRRIVVANNAYVLLDEPFPWAHGRLDYVFFAYSPFFDPHFFFAPGKVEVGLALQRAQNKFLNQSLDYLDLAIAPPIFADENILLDPRGMMIKAGRVIKTRGNPNEGLRAFEFPLQGIEFGINTVGALGTMIQKGTGIIDDVGQGLPSNPRETARGVLARSEAAGTRLDQECQLAEEMWLTLDADACMELDRQFLTEGRTAQLLGDLAVVDPITGGPNQMPAGSQVQVTPDDVAVRLRARAVGTSQRLSQAMRSQNFILTMQTAFQAAQMGGPAMMAQLNLLGWIRQLADINEIGSQVNELVVQNPQAYGAQLALQMMASQKQGPEAIIGQAEGSNLGGDALGTAAGGGVQAGAMPNGAGDIGQMAGSISGGLQ
jgi:hypothetical protein